MYKSSDYELGLACNHMIYEEKVIISHLKLVVFLIEEVIPRI